MCLGALACLALAACADSPPPGLEGAYGFSAVVFVQRPHLDNAGSLVAPDRAHPLSRAVLLRPAAPSGKIRPITDFDDGEVVGLDAAPDGERIVIALRDGPGAPAQLIQVDLARIDRGEACVEADGDLGPACDRLTFGPADDTRPVVLPDGRIAFTRADPDGPVDFQGRGPARTLMATEPDGTAVARLDYGPGHALGTRQYTDGWLRSLRWTQVEDGAGFLMTLIDPTGSRGMRRDGPATGATGLPMWVAPDEVDRVFAACLPPVGTYAAGSLCQQRPSTGDFQGVLSGIPTGAGCSPEGRLRDPTPLEDGNFLISYAKVTNGCVSIADDDLGLVPDFGVAVIDARTGERRPVFNDPDFDEVWVRPVWRRALLDPEVALPARPELGCETQAVRFEGVLDDEALAAGAVRVRALQGLTAAEARFAMSLGGDRVGAICRAAGGLSAEAPVHADGSWSLDAPAGQPIRLLALDRYGAAVDDDPRWRGGPACAVRRCAACHENDGQPADFAASLAAGLPAADLSAGPGDQQEFDFRRDIQPVLTRACATAGCHDETASGSYVTLDGALVGLDLRGEPSGRTTVAYQNLMLVDRRRANDGRILEERRPYVVPGQARESRLVQKLGAPCRFDCAGAPAWAPWGLGADDHHPEDQPGFAGTLSDADRWLLVDWIDAGAPFHGRGATP